ncbi:MAG: hypothetical protein ACMXYL_05225 [Candidatus Woesearchaeota archaeon]
MKRKKDYNNITLGSYDEFKQSHDSFIMIRERLGNSITRGSRRKMKV